MPRVYTPNEAAAALRVHVDTVRAAIRSGRLDACRVGGVLRITEPQLEAFLHARPTAPALAVGLDSGAAARAALARAAVAVRRAGRNRE